MRTPNPATDDELRAQHQGFLDRDAADPGVVSPGQRKDSEAIVALLSRINAERARADEAEGKLQETRCQLNAVLADPLADIRPRLQMEMEIGQLRAALSWYADDHHYQAVHAVEQTVLIMVDYGARARDALEPKVTK